MVPQRSKSLNKIPSDAWSLAMTASNNAPRLGMFSICTCPATPLKHDGILPCAPQSSWSNDFNAKNQLNDALHSGSTVSSSKKTCGINRLSGLIQTNQLQIFLSKCIELADWQVWTHLKSLAHLHMLQPLVWVSVDGSWEFSPHRSKLQMLCGNEARTEYHST